MILNSPLISSIRQDTISEQNDSIIRIPALILPVAFLRQPSEIGPTFVNTIGWPAPSATDRTLAQTTVLTSYQEGKLASTAITNTRLVRLGPGMWSIRFDIHHSYDYAEASNSTKGNINARSEDESAQVVLTHFSNDGLAAGVKPFNKLYEVQLSISKGISFFVAVQATGVAQTTTILVNTLAQKMN